MAHVELPEEELQPLIESIKDNFKPLTKAMPLIAKIPEELKRIADVISKDVESGVPEKIAEGVDKLTKDEAEEQLRAGLSEKANKHLEKQTELLEVLLDRGIPAKLDENDKVVKLTEKEIVETQKTFIQEKEKQVMIEKQLRAVEKSNMSDEKMAEEIKKLNEKMKKSREREDSMQRTLGGRTPVPKSDGMGFEAQGTLGEMFETGKETFMAPVTAIQQLNASLNNNLIAPFKNFFKKTVKHQKQMEEYGETGERSDKISIATALAVGGAIAMVADTMTKLFAKTPAKQEAQDVTNTMISELQSRIDQLEESPFDVGPYHGRTGVAGGEFHLGPLSDEERQKRIDETRAKIEAIQSPEFQKLLLQHKKLEQQRMSLGSAEREKFMRENVTRIDNPLGGELLVPKGTGQEAMTILNNLMQTQVNNNGGNEGAPTSNTADRKDVDAVKGKNKSN